MTFESSWDPNQIHKLPSYIFIAGCITEVYDEGECFCEWNILLAVCVNYVKKKN